MTKITAKIITYKKDKDIVWINTYRNRKRSSRIGIVKDEMEAISKALYEYSQDPIEEEERCEDCGHKPCDGGSYYCKAD